MMKLLLRILPFIAVGLLLSSTNLFNVPGFTEHEYGKSFHGSVMPYSQRHSNSTDYFDHWFETQLDFYGDHYVINGHVPNSIVTSRNTNGSIKKAALLSVGINPIVYGVANYDDGEVIKNFSPLAYSGEYLGPEYLRQRKMEIVFFGMKKPNFVALNEQQIGRKKVLTSTNVGFHESALKNGTYRGNYRGIRNNERFMSIFQRPVGKVHYEPFRASDCFVMFNPLWDVQDFECTFVEGIQGQKRRAENLPVEQIKNVFDGWNLADAITFIPPIDRFQDSIVGGFNLKLPDDEDKTIQIYLSNGVSEFNFYNSEEHSPWLDGNLWAGHLMP